MYQRRTQRIKRINRNLHQKHNRLQKEHEQLREESDRLDQELATMGKRLAALVLAMPEEPKAKETLAWLNENGYTLEDDYEFDSIVHLRLNGQPWMVYDKEARVWDKSQLSPYAF